MLVDELSGIAAMAVLAPEDELEMIAAAAAACHPTGAVELAGTKGALKGAFAKKALPELN